MNAGPSGAEFASPPSSRTNNAMLIALFVAVTLLAVGGALLYYQGESAEVFDDARTQLETIARLKHRQLETWRMERLGDGEVLLNGNSLSKPLVEALAHGSTGTAGIAPLEEWLGVYIAAYHQYDRAFLLSADLTVMASTPAAGEAPAQALLDAAQSVMRTREVGLFDFYLDERDGRPHLALAAPVLDREADNRAVGAVILRIDPTTELYPVLEIEEGNSETGETELLRREGREALFLNPLRLAKTSALTLKTPIDDAGRLAAQAAAGATGHVRGVDYRSAEVLGYITPVSGSPWLLVTRIDVAELNTTLRSHLWVVTSGVVLLLASTGLTLGFWRRDQRLEALAGQAALAFRLRDSEERLRLALSSAAQGLYDLDLATGRAIVNDEYAVMLGHDPNGFTESLDSWTERLHPEDRQQARQALANYLDGQTPIYRVEVRMRTAGGGWRWILSVGQVVSRDANGQPRRMLGTHTDITPLKWAQDGQMRAVAQLRNLLANSPTVVYSVHLIGGQRRLVAVSENVERILGFTAEEVMQPEFWPTQVHTDDRGLQAQVATEIATADHASHVYRFHRRDGRCVWVQDRLTVLRRNADGTPIEMAGALSDITLQHEAELALRASEERLRLAMASARQGIWDLRLDTGDTIISPEYEAMLGYVPGSLEETAAAWNARVHPDDLERCQVVFHDYLAGRRPDYVIEFRQRMADGGWIWIHSTGRVIERAADGRPLRMLGIHTDITPRKHAELAAARLSGLYRTLSRCNEAIVRSASPAELFDAICAAVVDFGDFEMAWVGMVDPADLTIRCAATAGAKQEYLEGLTLTLNPDDPAGQGPLALAIRNSAPFWFDDVEAAAIESPLMTRIRQYGWLSMGAVPLMQEGVAVGALGIYSGRLGAFDEDSRRLLVELAANLSFALDGFAREARREHAESRLRQSETRYRTLFAESSVPMLLVDTATGDIADANEAACEYFGFSAPALRQMNMRAIDTLPASRVEKERVEAAQQPRVQFNTQVQLASGERRDVEMFVAQMMVDGARRSLAIVSDVTARNAAEVALLEKEFQLTEAQRLARIGSWTRLADGSGTWTDEMFRLFGLPVGPAPPSGEEVLARVHPDDRAVVTAARAAHFHGERNSTMEFRVVRPDGSTRYLLERGELRTLPGGQDYIAGTIQDVTERKRAEQTIRQSEERIRLALSAARMGLWDFDTTTGVLLVNPVNPDGPGFLDVITPTTREEFVAAFHPDERARAAEVFTAFASGTDQVFDEEFRLLMPDGSSRWTHSTGKLVERDASGRGLRIVGVARDITERHGLMEALRLRDRAIESSLSAIAIADLDGHISYANQAFADMWDLATPQDAVGRSTASLLHNPETARFMIADMLQRRGPWSGELRAVSAVGRLRDVLASAAFVTDDGNEPIGLVAAFVDITDRKLSEQATAASLREKEALLKEVHHRVKNNLQVISSLLRLELGRTTEPGVKQVLGEMQNRILSMALLHETLYRSDDLSRVDLSRYLERLVQQVFRSAAPSGGRVTLHVSLEGASVDLEQAVPCGLLVTELVSNSLKHAFPDSRAGEVRVALAYLEDGETLRLSVSDSGIGLPEDFDTRRSKSLGLVLVSDLVRQLRGSLDIDAEHGATFTVTFRPRQLFPSRPSEAAH